MCSMYQGLRNLFGYVSRNFQWFFEARIPLLTVAMVAAALILLRTMGISECTIRVAGFFLQFSGICSVAWGVRETRVFFDRPSIFGHFRNWLSRRPKWKGVRHEFSCTSAGHATATCTGEVWRPRLPGDTLEQRVEKVEKNVQELADRIEERKQEIAKGLRDHALKISAEEQARREQDDILRTTLIRSATGGLHISLMGLVWLTIGTFFSSFPTEISTLLACK